MNDMNHMINVPHHSEPVPEWEMEPNEVTFVSHGYWCVIKRHDHLGHLSGYVLMGAHHPLASVTDPDLAVHGGITFNDGVKMGFDCAHAGDLVPHARMRADFSNPAYETYRNMYFVKEQLKNLAAQLREADPMEVPDGILPAM
jgi:hypothetical protein